MRTILPLVVSAALLACGVVFVLAPSGSATTTVSTVDSGTSVVPAATATPMGGSNLACC
ncbi:hypothetical protein ACFW1A_04795 [Kitasatospora sp. NPDC058965]|uniref:hypothetical protein n=1 Tax=Kitasatospora sp. NPDC058965 TaxID=3346682 RepID=UPI00368DBA5D